MEDYNQIFLGQDGNKILSDIPDNFSKYFDWQITRSKIFKKTDIPRTIYLKTDFLPLFVNITLPKINNQFILITACSDYSPEINFNKQYNILINHSKLKFWFMNNMKTKNEKSFSLPCGLGAGRFWNNCNPKEIDDIIIKIRNSVNNDNKITNKIFCCFREAYFNVCGNDMFIRPAISKIVNKNKDLFDIYEPDSMNFETFIKTLSRYKYSLCPHGNGMDPSPTCWLSLAVNTIPVIYRIPNTIDMFNEIDSVIFFDNFEDITNKNIYIDKSYIDFDFLTCKYWSNMINSKIQN